MSEELHLDVPEGVNAHLMWADSNPPKFPRQVARVGYWLATDEKGEVGVTQWFDVNGSEADAQAVLDEQATLHLLDAVAAQIAAEEAPKPVTNPTDKKKTALEKARAKLNAKLESDEVEEVSETPDGAESDGGDEATPVPRTGAKRGRRKAQDV